MIDAIFFDLGDTIINFGIGRAEAEVFFARGARQSYEYLAARGKPLPPFAPYVNAHYRRMRNRYMLSRLTGRDFSYGEVIAAATRRLRIPLRDHEVHELAWSWYLPIAQAAHIDPGLHAMLGELRAAGTRLAIVSNTFVPGHCLDRHLEREGLLEFFPVRVYSSHVRYRKPHRRIFEIALDQVGVAASRALFIGDLLRADVHGAQRAGMQAIWKPAAHLPFKLKPLRRPPTRTIRRITQLSEILPELGWRATPAPAAATA